MGRIVDVIVDGEGRARAAIIDFGGFLGVGSRKIAVDWNALHFVPSASRPNGVVLELTRDQVKPRPGIQGGQADRRIGPIGCPGTVSHWSAKRRRIVLPAQPSHPTDGQESGVTGAMKFATVASQPGRADRTNVPGLPAPPSAA